MYYGILRKIIVTSELTDGARESTSALRYVETNFCADLTDLPVSLYVLSQPRSGERLFRLHPKMPKMSKNLATLPTKLSIEQELPRTCQVVAWYIHM
jgi:hypothetical protein